MNNGNRAAATSGNAIRESNRASACASAGDFAAPATGAGSFSVTPRSWCLRRARTRTGGGSEDPPPLHAGQLAAHDRLQLVEEGDQVRVPVAAEVGSERVRERIRRHVHAVVVVDERDERGRHAGTARKRRNRRQLLLEVLTQRLAGLRA